MTSHSPQGFAVLPATIARDPDIEPILKALLLALSSYAGADQSCYPSNKTLCDCTGLSERAVREWLGTGAQRGLLTVHRRTMDNGAPASNLYSLNFAKWGDSLTRQMVPGVSADSAGGVGRHGAPGGAQPCPRWGATVPPNNTNEQDQENITKEQDAPLPLVAAPVKESKQELQLVAKQPKARFVAPTEDEVCEAMNGNRNEAIKFCAYYGSKGWVVGKAPMKDWRQAVRGWMARKEADNRQPRNGPGPGMMRTPAGWMPEPERKYDEPDVLF